MLAVRRLAGIIGAMIVDFHTHVLPREVRDNRAEYARRDPVFAELYASPQARIVTADELVSAMDREGVDVSVVLNIGWTTQQLCVETNDYILEAAARFPARLVPFCAVQPRAGHSAVMEIERCVRGGARGIGELRPDVQLAESGPEVMAGLAEVIRRNNLIVTTHASEPVGHRYNGKGRVTPDYLCRLIEVLPDITIVCSHWGGGLPFYALMPEVKEALARVYFDTAASPFLYRPQVYRQVIALVGEDKVLFGSDYPLMPPSRLIKEIDALALPPATREKVLSGNARRLLNIFTFR